MKASTKKTATKTATKKAPTNRAKLVAPKSNDIVAKVAIAKGSEGLIYSTKAPSVTVESVNSAGKTMTDLCIAFLHGNAPSVIYQTAQDKDKPMSKVFPLLDSTSRSRITRIAKVSPKVLRDKWLAYLKTKKVVREPNLTGLAMAIGEKQKDGINTVSFKDQFIAAWESLDSDKQNNPDYIVLADLYSDAKPVEKA